MNNKIIIFGGSGFLGKYFSKQLLDLNYEITIFDLNKPDFGKSNLKYVKGNILNYESVLKAIKDNHIVMNFAGWAEITNSHEKPYDVIKQNVEGNLVLLEACRKKKIKRYIYASSLYVFSEYGSFYRASKQSSELIIKEYQKRFNIPYTILRFGSLYGPGSQEGNAIFDMLSMAIKNKKIVYWGKGDEVRQYIHARDAAKVCLKLFNKEYINKFILLTGLEDIRVRDLLNLINEIFEKKIKIEYKLNKKSFVHYKNTPFTIPENPSFIADLGEKMIFQNYTDIGQGIYENILYMKKYQN